MGGMAGHLWLTVQWVGSMTVAVLELGVRCTGDAANLGVDLT